MPINVKITSTSQPSAEPITVKIKGPKIMTVEYKLDMRRALNGDIMIFDHQDIDIIILTEKKKVVAFAKDMMSEAVYGAEKRLFDHLRKKGIIQFDSIEGGSVYGSLQGILLESKEVNSVKVTLYEVSQWLETERPHFNNSYDDMLDDSLLNPNEEDSTELGEVPHEEEKGSIRQHGLFAPYMYGRYIY